MKNPELQFALECVTAFMAACEPERPQPDCEFVNWFTKIVYLIGDHGPNALEQMKPEEIDQALTVAKKLLDHFAMQESKRGFKDSPSEAFDMHGGVRLQAFT